MLLFMVPGLGIIFYILFSQNISRRRIFRLTNYEHLIITEALDEQMTSIKSKEFRFTNDAAKKWQHMI